MSSAIVVIARWEVPVAALDGLLQLVGELRQRSLEEPGCLGYEILRRDDVPNCLILLERYRDDEALEAHRGSEHYQELVVARIRPMLTSRRVEILRPDAS